MTKLIKQGQGWRLGWDSQAEVFKGLVGGEDWAIELTEAEFNDFCRLFHQLAETMAQMAGELMDQEKISCEAESELLWLEVEGYPDAYSLRLLLLTGRRGEGFWTSPVIPELLQAAQVIQVF